MIPLLDACLVDGFGSGNVDSIVVASGIATVMRSLGHPFEVGSVALISGATITGGTINGERKVKTRVSSTVYTFDATGIPDGTATGSISHKFAPAGWSKAFMGTGLAVYQSSDPASTACYLRIDDTNALHARARAYESMSDVNTGTGPFPTDAQISGGAYWPRSNSNGGTSRPWFLIADSRTIHLLVNFTGSTSYGFCASFGDLITTKSPDAYGCYLNGYSTSSFDQPGSAASDMDLCNSANTADGFSLARSHTTLNGAVNGRRSYDSFFNGTARSGATGLPYPNRPNNALYVAPLRIIEQADGSLRGIVPGVEMIPQNCGTTAFANAQSVEAVEGLSGRIVRMFNSNIGVVGFDTTGPWR